MRLTRTHGRTMGTHRAAAAAAAWQRSALSRPPHGLQRLVLDPQHRLAVAGPARAVRAVEDRVQPLQPLAERGPDRPHPRGVAGPPGRGRPHRLGPVVRRWQLGPGAGFCGRGGQKRGPQEPADHALGRSRGGWGTKIHVVTDGHGTPLSVHVTPGQAHESAAFEAAVTATRIGGRRRASPGGSPATRATTSRGCVSTCVAGGSGR